MCVRNLHYARYRGFTLVELMVALSGGLFVSIAVFVLAKNASALYQSESRLADATFGAVIGFERLRADILRAGFLGVPNIRDSRQAKQRKYCNSPTKVGNYPFRLGRLASVFVAQEAPGALPPILADNGITPNRIELTGSYAASEMFAASHIGQGGGGFQVTLDPDSPAMYRIGYSGAGLAAADQVALMQRIFGPGRALRIWDKDNDEIQFGTISGTFISGNGRPVIQLTNAPTIQFDDANPLNCGLSSTSAGSLVNVINFVRYRIADVRAMNDPRYNTLFAAPAPTDGGRTELIREELDVNGDVIPNTMEVITEFAVDFQVQVIGATVVPRNTPNGDPGADQIAIQLLPPNAPNMDDFAGDPTIATHQPERLRGLRIRLGVRSREADREGDVSPLAGPGLFRMGLGPGGTAPFARVRTQQADISLRNQLRPE